MKFKIPEPWLSNKPIYKYIPKEYLKDFFERGILRIGTLLDFQNEEQHGVKRGDRNEGLKNIYENLNIHIEDPNKEKLSDFARGFINNKGKNNKFENVLLDKTFISSDYYILCFSKNYDRHLLKKFGGGCIKVKKPYKFIKTISIVLFNTGFTVNKNSRISPIKYTNRKQDYHSHDQIHPVFIKDNIKSFTEEKEVRAIWTPIEQKLEPQYIKLDKKYINRFCEQYFP